MSFQGKRFSITLTFGGKQLLTYPSDQTISLGTYEDTIDISGETSAKQLTDLKYDKISYRTIAAIQECPRSPFKGVSSCTISDESVDFSKASGEITYEYLTSDSVHSEIEQNTLKNAQSGDQVTVLTNLLARDIVEIRHQKDGVELREYIHHLTQRWAFTRDLRNQNDENGLYVIHDQAGKRAGELTCLLTNKGKVARKEQLIQCTTQALEEQPGEASSQPSGGEPSNDSKDAQ